MYRYPNVYGDLSLCKCPPRPFHRHLRGLIVAGLGQRPEVIDETIEAIESAPFPSQGRKRDICRGKAARFLRLSEEEIERERPMEDSS